MTENTFNQFVGHIGAGTGTTNSRLGGKMPEPSLLPTEVNQEVFLETLAAKSASRLPEGLIPVTGKQLKKMQDFGKRWRKRHPLGTQEQMEKAIKGFFNLNVVKEAPVNVK